MQTNSPPNNQDYEKSILCSILMDQEALDFATELLIPQDFYVTKHQHIFRCVGILVNENAPVDLPSLGEKLRTEGKLDDVGAGFLAQLLDFPMATNPEWYCKKIKEKAALRRVIEICNASMKRAFKDDEPAIDIIDKFQADIYSINLSVSPGNNTSIAELIGESLDQYAALNEATDGITGIPSGLYQFDYITCGFQKSDLDILAGRPSMGKTALALNITKHTASQGHAVQWFSLEMSKRQLRDRLMASEAMVNGQKFRSGGFTSDEYTRIEKAQAVLYQFPISIDDEAGISIAEIRRRARKYKAERQTELIIVDHLQLIGSGLSDNRNDELGLYTRALKALAKELDVTVLCLSQLNRNLEHRNDKTPRLADLRESGNIEQDADNVFFIHRPGKYPDLEERYEGETQLIISKQRNGPVGNVDLEWHEGYQQFKVHDDRLKDYNHSRVDIYG